MVMFAGGLLVLLSVLASRWAGRVGIPSLLLFLGIGMLAGSEGPGGIAFDDHVLAEQVGVVCLALILFSGGLDTRWSEVRGAARLAAPLATVGVLVTAGVVAVAASAVLSLPWREALVVGAVVSSTDAAAVFGVLRSSGVALRGRLEGALELESGANDPMAVFLTLTAIALVQDPSASALGFVASFVAQAVVGAGVGAAAGWAGGRLVNRVGAGLDALYPALTLGVGLLAFSVAALLGGSGFLAVYVAGVVLASGRLAHRGTITRVHEALAWMSQIALFLVLGLLVFPSRLPEVALEAVAIAVVLVLLARPAAVGLSLLGSRLGWRDRTLVAWVGLRGAVPIVLATFVLAEGVPGAERTFDVVFVVVLVSVLVQGPTVGRAARLLGVDEAPAEQPGRGLEALDDDPEGAGLHRRRVEAGAPADGARLAELGLAPGCLVVLVTRAGHHLVPEGETRLEAGDELLVVAHEAELAVLEAAVRNER